MCAKRLCILFCLALFSLGVFAQDLIPAQPQDQLLLQQMSLSQQVRSALLDSKASMEKSNEYFSDMIASLEERTETQSKELTTLWQLWTDTTTSFDIASTALEQSNNKLDIEKQHSRNLLKALVWVAMILGVWTALKVVRIILGFVRPEINKIIPQWVDIII